MNAIRALAARGATLTVSFVCGVITARLILSETSVQNYALYTLIAALPALIPATDLGAGAAVVNTAARSKDVRQDRLLAGQALSAMRVMTMAALVLLSVNIVLFTTGTWPEILGAAGSTGAGVVAFTCVTAYCIALPLGLWTRLLVGLGRNHVMILIQGSQGPVTLIAVYLIVRTEEPNLQLWAAGGSFIASTASMVAGFLVADRATGGVLRSTVARLPFTRRVRGARVMDVGLPMFAQTITPPLANQATRFIVAQTVTVTALAQHSLLMQVLLQLISLVAAVGTSLWPYYARAQANGAAVVGPFRMCATFIAGALVASAMWVVAAPLLYSIMTGDTVVVPQTLVACFALQLLAQAALYPLGMYLMTPSGIRFQTIPSIVSAVITVLGVVVLTPRIGIVAVPLCITGSTLLAQIVPYSIRILRDRRADSDAPRAREEPSDARTA